MGPRPDAIEVVGLGAAGPPGWGAVELWKGVLVGSSNFAPIDTFDAKSAITEMVGWFPDDAPLPSRGSPQRLIQAATAVVEEACVEAGWHDRSDVVLVFGTTSDGDHSFEEAYLHGSPSAARLTSAITEEIAARAGMRRHGLTTCSASASGAVAVGLASDLLLTGTAKRVVVAAADGISRSAFFGLNSLRTLSAAGCRPFSRRRRGIRIAEAAAAIALEAKPAAATRRPTIVGYGASNMADHPARPHAEGIRLAVEACLAEGGDARDVVDYVNVHGPGTRHGDQAELTALELVFGDQLPAIALSSSKPVLGHGQGAAGLVELVLTIQACDTGLLPPTHGLDDVEPKWSHLDFVPQPREAPVRAGMSISCGLGGINAAVLVRSGR